MATKTLTGDEVRKMRDDEIVNELARLRNHLFDLRSQTVTAKVEDTSQFGKVRKDIARLLTEQTARRIKNAPAKPAAAKTAGTAMKTAAKSTKKAAAKA